MKPKPPRDPGKLTDDQKEYVIERLAGFTGPGTVAAELLELYGVKIARQSVESYDPTKRAGRGLTKGLKALFEATRAKIIEGGADIGFRNKMVRVLALDQMARAAIEEKDRKGAAELLEQIAKEMGEAFTNRHRLEHTGKNGGPIQVAHDARDRIFKRLDDIREKRLAGGTAGDAVATGSGEPAPGAG